MKRMCKNVNCVKTEILTWGEPFFDRKQDIIVCITGNPGITDFYIDFASELYKAEQMPICVIGHAGHDGNFNDKSHGLVNNEHLFSLDAQIKHKLDFLENHVHPNSKIHLIGHSIGAWIIVELLHKYDQLKDRVLTINLLFPTLQRMAESKNAVRSLPNNYCDAILKMINPFILEKILIMGYDEMDIVKELNRDGIDKIKHLTHVIYGIRDNWAPLDYMDDLKKYEPYIKMTKAHDVEHAFVLKSSEQVADMVAKFIKSKVKG